MFIVRKNSFPYDNNQQFNNLLLHYASYMWYQLYNVLEFFCVIITSLFYRLKTNFRNYVLSSILLDTKSVFSSKHDISSSNLSHKHSNNLVNEPTTIRYVSNYNPNNISNIELHNPTTSRLMWSSQGNGAINIKLKDSSTSFLLKNNTHIATNQLTRTVQAVHNRHVMGIFFRAPAEALDNNYNNNGWSDNYYGLLTDYLNFNRSHVRPFLGDSNYWCLKFSEPIHYTQTQSHSFANTKTFLSYSINTRGSRVGAKLFLKLPQFPNFVFYKRLNDIQLGEYLKSRLDSNGNSDMESLSLFERLTALEYLSLREHVFMRDRKVTVLAHANYWGNMSDINKPHVNLIRLRFVPQYPFHTSLYDDPNYRFWKSNFQRIYDAMCYEWEKKNWVDNKMRTLSRYTDRESIENLYDTLDSKKEAKIYPDHAFLFISDPRKINHPSTKFNNFVNFINSKNF